ncbi:MAG TPA: diguanylate cyclase [Thermodesulfovibrionales bacterium]|nr:diguanylate cyclase [Thermodesulfovibrionales bacterium]
MSKMTLITSLLVLFGAALMFTAILQGRKIQGIVPPELKRRWRTMVTLMLFFLVGYICFVLILIGRLTLPVELITGLVFMGGAFFVFIVINLTRDTIIRTQSAEEKLRILNESLERRVSERTRDLEQSNAFLRTVLDTLNDEVLIIDTNTYRIQDANESFLVKYGLTLEQVVGRTCHEVTHNRMDVCSPPHDLCPLLETVNTRRFSAAEHIHFLKDGRRFFAEVSTAPIVDPDGSVRKVVHVARDITPRKEADEALRRSEERYKNFFDSTLDGIFRVDAEGSFTLMNLSGARIFGYETPGDIVGKDFSEYWRDPNDIEVFWSELNIVKSVSAYPIKARKKNGESIELESSSRIMEDENGIFLGIEGILRDVTERKHMEEELISMSLKDALTGLYNRRGFMILADQELKMANRLKRGIYILYADLDGMKMINDTLGHEEGDRALMETAVFLKETFRNSDIIARIGGDEFVIVPIGTASDNVDAIISRLQGNLDAKNKQSGRKYILSLSIGVSYYNPECPDTLDELLSKADALMYDHKRSKRKS